MNDDQFERLLCETEGIAATEVQSRVGEEIAKHGDQLSDRQRVDLLYLEYLTRSSDGDTNVLDDLCQRYPETATKLKRQAEVDTELSRLDDDADLDSPSIDQPATPDKIGEYTVVEKIGEGSQAEVYRVIHPMLRCELAMKVGKCPTEAADRILDEGRLLVTVNDSGIARVIDAGLWQDRPFIVSELIRGVTLKQRVDNRALSHRESAEIVMRLARTVESLHSAGIVHCDIKSTNVLVDTAGNPKLVDFGLAINRSVDAWDQNAVNRGDHSGGTLVYMAPELFSSTTGTGRHHSRQPVSDVFSLGSLLYFALVGDHPYASASSRDIVERVATGKWNREALHASGAPKKLIELCEAAMVVTPNERTESAGLFATELQHWLQRQDSQPLRTKTIIAVAIVSLGLIGWIAWRPGTTGSTAPLPLVTLPVATASVDQLGSLDVKIWSEDRAFELVHRVPVRSGEGVQINAPLRGGRRGELWLVSSEGNAERLASFPVEDESRWVHYPAELDRAVPLTGPAGTEAVVWLEFPNHHQTRGDESLRQLSKTLRPSEKWPSIDDAMVFRLVDGSLSVEQDGRSFGSPQEIEAPSAIVQKHLRQASEELTAQGVSVEIIAFSHAD
ncbi:Serine/threonine-protein kinase PknL [Rubripirellula amarantea]|uniref:Serine/threonine-protein kinase PknL n=1 Tax=Rubripirellula amarantea TaxID=2527999 RepID=A0A5C5WKY3_9BACT|nr:serine/threonine-protein kinase [Rubripirellula amarantea]TWT51434.1 Serine/threonine-protein kinase PknL [Rubripirellula amarantea]